MKISTMTTRARLPGMCAVRRAHVQQISQSLTESLSLGIVVTLSMT